MIWFIYCVCIVMVFGSLFVAFRVFRITNEFHSDKVYYGELHSLHPDTRSFETFEPVYWCGNRYCVLGSETYDLTKRTILTLSRHHSLYVRAVDSREVKKIIKGEIR